MVTIQDIANEVGISKAAVSRILNHKGSFSQETIVKVERAAKKLGYVSSAMLQREETRSHKIIAVILPSNEIPQYYGFFASLLEQVAYDYGYSVLLCGSLFDREKELMFLQKLQEKKIDGIILGSYTYDASMVEDQDLPIVTFGYQLAPNIPVVRTDNYAAGRIAGKHLLSKGCKKLLYISGYPGGLELDLRYQGFWEEVKKHNCELWSYYVSVDMQIRNNCAGVITQMALEHPDADGIFTETEILGMRCIQIYSGLGYRIPENIKIISYGTDFISSLSTPKMTLVKENSIELAKKLVGVLVDLIEDPEWRGRNITQEIIVPVSLEEQKTT